MSSSTLHNRALDDLRYIRETMESASAFTARLGAGADRHGRNRDSSRRSLSRELQPGPYWLGIWLAAAALAVVIGVTSSIWKGRRAREPFIFAPLRKFVLGFAPPISVGVVLTFYFARLGLYALLPAVLAPPLRRGRHDGRHVLRALRSRHGHLLHGTRMRRRARARRLDCAACSPPASARCRSSSAPSSRGATVARSSSAARRRTDAPVARPLGAEPAKDAAKGLARARRAHSPSPSARHGERARRQRRAVVQRAQIAAAHHRWQPQRPRAQARGRELRHRHEDVRGAAGRSRPTASPPRDAGRSSGICRTWNR